MSQLQLTYNKIMQCALKESLGNRNLPTRSRSTDRSREVTEPQGCHQRAPLLQAQEDFGDPEQAVAEEMEFL